MNASASSIPEMINGSIVVLTKPSVATFEQYERRGNLRTALIYVGVTAVISALLNGLGGAFSDQGVIRGVLSGLIGTFVSFLLFTGTTFYVGRSQGGTGTLDEVAYTFALFWVPLQIAVQILTFVLVITIIGICLVPFLALAAIAASIYFGYLAVQSSMNLRDNGKIWITLIAAGIASFLGSLLVGAIF